MSKLVEENQNVDVSILVLFGPNDSQNTGAMGETLKHSILWNEQHMKTAGMAV